MKFLLSAVFLLSLGVSLLRAEAPATQPATRGSDEKVVVKKATLRLRVDTEGVFVPQDPAEVRIRPRSFQGELRVKSSAASGQNVKAGDIVLSIESADINRAIATAENELKGARAALEKVTAENTLAEQADAISLKVAQADADQASAAIKWFDEIDGKHMLKRSELQVKGVQDSLNDQDDELDQLRKMYKSEELTNATADIVVKRAVRQLEQTKIQLSMAQESADKFRKVSFPRARQDIVVAADRSANALEMLKVTQKQSKVQREVSAATSKNAVELAEKKLAELQEDLKQFSFAAPFDGVVYIGSLVGGAWQNSDPKSLRSGEKIAPGQVLMTLVAPGKLQLKVNIPEATRFSVEVGTRLSIVPVALPQVLYSADLPESSRASVNGAFETLINVANIDPRITPAMKAMVRIDAGEVKDVLLVPASCVSFGKVKVGETYKDVQIGRSNGEQVEILSGLAEGDQINKSAR